MKLSPRAFLRMPRLGPAERVGLGLASIVVSCVLILDFAFDIFPDQRDEIRLERARISEQFAVQAATLFDTGGVNAMAVALPRWVEREPQLLSLGVRGENGKIITQTKVHNEHWAEADDDKSTLSHVRVPLMQGDQHWGTFELSFTPAQSLSILQWLTQPWLLIVLTLGLGGFVLFSLYLRRVFEYLDPQSVLPDRIKAAFDAFSEGVMVIDPVGRVILANSAIRQWVGKDGPSIHGRPVRKIDVLNAALPARTADHPWMRAMKQRTSVKGDYIEIEQSNGDLRKLTVNCSPVVDHDGAVRGCVTTFDDVTEIESINRQLLETLEELRLSRREVEERNKALHQMAMHDVLTGSLNRRAFFDFLEPAFKQARSNGEQMSCIMVDIDHFKSFNDRFGHAVGDEVLKVAAQILAGGVRSGDVLARYGGEEFCIVMPRTDIEEAVRVAERLRETIETRAAKSVRGVQSTPVTASFGIAILGHEHAACEDLIRDADQALYVAKDEGRNRVVVHAAAPDVLTA